MQSEKILTSSKVQQEGIDSEKRTEEFLTDSNTNSGEREENQEENLKWRGDSYIDERGERFVWDPVIRGYVWSPETVTCSLCGEVLSGDGDEVEQHLIQIHHAITGADGHILITMGGYVCPVCGVKMTSDQALSGHMNEEHGWPAGSDMSGYYDD